MELLPSLNGGRSSAWSPLTFTSKSAIIIGDSITAGSAATPSTNRFSTVLCGLLGCTEVNHGIGSSTMENRSPANPIGGTNMLQRLSDIPTKTGSLAVLVFAFGMNDWGYTGANYNVTNFKTDYNTALADALAKGWAKQEIVIVAPTYPTDAAFAFYAGLSGQAAPTRPRMLSFQQACLELAQENDVNLSLPYGVFEANDPASLIDTDGVHPLNAGHALLANTIYTLLTGTPVYNIAATARIGIAKSTITFAAAGLDDTNTNIVYLVDNPMKSWKPLRVINGITGFEAEKGYYIVGKKPLDKTDILVPPLDII